ncbi:VasL domain-containing protein [Enterobacter cloacae]|uniref:VasL domain-containing protein n=1 Tax=Enterobacter cloacae TaxID=550 RepID=UPI0022E0611D|nr:VasL domain-containing protein [Enterobacter cloacae]ELK7331906.1 type VI secretion system ImpA family N-terminal domain-containing protein [Enterobacter cloacae]ELK7336197.1 type VI secretion system ImpA family N-terminal domain-containing protein [Enterobacter cloacae]ELR9132689.1 type VI secretion system ImpA family N-terminal domain-containing protein [Enterobacter cloacae]ELR9134040.1 type VI secretion system ImpA family N-terminal domain-containing protein [Enterobacter cloacae]MCR155
MNGSPFRQIKTGSDPRTLPDYAALRDELSKLTHPARPDVNWHYVEKLCLSLFEQNGVELQTAAWYTFARTQLAGLPGLNEGLTILEALISHQWGTCWPQPVHARMEILSGLSQRLQQLMRTFSLNDSDLSQLYQAEQQLTALGEVLQSLELKHLSQLDTLCTLMHNSAVRLENSHDASEPGVVIQHPAAAGEFNHAAPENPLTTKIDPMKWVYVAQPEPQPNIDVVEAIPDPVKPWRFFAAGMCTMLVAGAAAVWGWQHFNRPDPQEQQLLATLAPLPAMLTPAQRDAARQRLTSPESFIEATQQQLTRLDALPPDWNIAYSRQLVEQAQVLWPEPAESMALQWQQQLNASALPTENLEGWHQGMTKLKQLSDRLNQMDEQKGKYMTVSELKSVVFSAMQSFNQAIPAEEQLRVLAKSPAGQPLPVAASAQTEMYLKQLTVRYSEIKQKASSK